VNEFHDPELERMLGRASGAYPDANVAFETVRGRVRQVKRRRAMVASTAACVVLVGVVALALRGSDETQVQPIHQSDTSSSMEVATTSPKTAMSPPDTEMTSDTTVADATVETMDTVSGSPGGPGVNSGPGTSGGNGKGGKGTTTSAPTSTTTATTVPSLVKPTTPTEVVTTYASKGGSVSVQIVNRRMVLVGTFPSAGFTAHVNEASGDRIRVEFANGGSTYEIQLELSNGKITSSTQNKGA
jgi:hypothetical protein